MNLSSSFVELTEYLGMLDRATVSIRLGRVIIGKLSNGCFSIKNSY